jgi:polyferredoxin
MTLGAGAGRAGGGRSDGIEGIEGPEGIDWLHVPLVGPFLRHRYARPILQIPLFLGALALIAHGFWGPQLAPKNLATVVTWVHYRGALVLVLLLAGNLFCMGCPFMLPRALARKIFQPVRTWPSRLRNKGVALALFAAVLFAYELFDLWGSPWWTAWLIVAYFAGALLVDANFRHAPFCKWVCPLGQFNFAASTLSPLEVTVRAPDVCATCTTYDCIRGRRDPEEPSRVVQRGCELALFLPNKVGNMDCTFCLDCAHACPHDNVALTTRLPGSELWVDPRRSGIGRFSKRKDLAALALLFTFGALLNVFGMVSPVYVLETWLAGVLGTKREVWVLGILFTTALVVEPLVLLGAASFFTRLASAKRGAEGEREPLLLIATRYSYSLVPLGFAVWLAHYSFHLLTGLWTVIPVAQGALRDAGITLFGAPRWDLRGIPLGFVAPIQHCFLALGLIGSLLVAYQIAARDHAADPRRARRAFAPWAALFLLLWGTAMWLLAQPMEMRGMMLGS